MKSKHAILMERILDRYERCSYAGQDIPAPSLDSQGECSTECSKLLRMIDAMQRSLRHLKGEEEKELKELKKQLTKKVDQREDFEPQNLSQGLASLAMQPPCEPPHPLPPPISPPPPPLSLRDTSQSFEAGEVDAGTLTRPTNLTLPHWMPRVTEE
ncbi:unnamed protein product [Thlaspi arvense]|uniref:Uncharacterized protein n=1 Tax=Thlaspi arvense TaxID=13288 RepID=A0AAU9RLK2_THLAR|nr:unnamed protein product [Thlaspi arvense]